MAGQCDVSVKFIFNSIHSALPLPLPSHSDLRLYENTLTEFLYSIQFRPLLLPDVFVASV